MKNKSSGVIEALVFDVDGTLADTERDGHRCAFNEAFEEYGIGWYWDVELYGRLLAVSGGKERIQFFIESFLPENQRPQHPDRLAAALHRIKTRRYIELVESGRLALRPGVKRLLKEARDAGLRLAIATTTTPDNVTTLLRHSLAEDAEKWFEVIAAGDVVLRKKPAPDVYLWALERLRLSPHQCMAFEDSENGLKSSLAAGLKTVITVSSYSVTDNFEGACVVLSDLGEPDAPFKTLAGNAYGRTYVDIALIERWAEKC
ncbi:MAG: HAD-IA family hydrolase [Methylophilaceae bacterium]|nr:HAD-IA family hydrolase [Methylophilaceae bacterium]